MLFVLLFVEFVYSIDFVNSIIVVCCMDGKCRFKDSETKYIKVLP